MAARRKTSCGRSWGSAPTFLGWLGGEDLARAYASADVFLFASTTDTYGQVIVEAAASGLPVVAVAEGGPAALVENRHTGLLCRPDPDHLAGALLQLAAAPLLRRQLGAAGAARGSGAHLGALAGAARGRLPARPGGGRGGAAAGPRPGRLIHGRIACLPSTMGRSTIPLSTSTASSPGWSSTSGFSSWPRTPQVPLLERLRFCAIYASNLDEFFMVRVAGLFDQLDAGIDARGPDGLAPATQIDRIQARVLEHDRRLQACFGGVLRPALEEQGIRIISLQTASAEERREIDARFHEQVFPALTPLVIGLGRPFPYISNLSLSLGVLLRDPESGTEIIARVKVPKELLGRFLPVGDDGHVVRAAGGGDRRQPRRPLPRHRRRRPRLLPGHPRRRLHRLRRGRRPPAGGPGRAPPPPLRRGRAARDRRRDEPEAARVS